jgi:hypothetical protein
MPEISRFYGIIIRMFFRDHVPAHFHALYSEHEAQIGIIDGEIIEGELPTKALRLVQAWVELHRDELLLNYNESQKEGGIISKIAPLK